ncbi:MAG: DUF2306 domain-containing protein [Sphingomonas sp.]
MVSLAPPAPAAFARASAAGRLLRWSAILLAAACWFSAALFGVYIVAFFGGMALGGAPDRWNEALPGLHAAGAPLAAVAIGAHFVTGGTLLLLGPVQLIGAVRRRAPAVHRWIGRAYVSAAAVAGLGGLGFIVSRGTIGGAPMDLGFGIYGALMVACAALAYAHGRARRIEAHRAWAIRLFALAVGSWLYRIDYGFWFLAFGRLGHTGQFKGWFDVVMAFFFYVPNLAVAELFIRARRNAGHPALQSVAALMLLGATGFVALATWFFFVEFWAPGIADGVAAIRA